MAQTNSTPTKDTQALDATRITALLKALADPTRLRLYLLLRRGEACVCELAAELELAENLVSHHLGVLRRLGLVRDRRDTADARWVYYTLDTGTLRQLAAELGLLFNPDTIGTRTPTCGPAALLTPQRATPRQRASDSSR
ncbi:MAG: hypothetical protein OJF49_002378 [Ktedonobacterales bacterium]|jgi:ArsR family transcriptional regulator|nr:MAG: hypothetical protein OJF49_002378 [Ktedonobacterales bacterium]